MLLLNIALTSIARQKSRRPLQQSSTGLSGFA